MTERGLSRDDSVLTSDKIRVFSLDSLGIDTHAFVASLAPTFGCLPWDLYDVRREQISQVLQTYPSLLNADTPTLMKQYYMGHVGMQALDRGLNPLPAELKDSISAIEPFRRRAISSYFLARAADGTPVLTTLPQGAFEQAATPDYRAWPRSFEGMSEEVTGCPYFRMFLMGVGGMVWKAEPTARLIRMTVHQVSTIARRGRPGASTPEGIHQDGADYVVSALVVSRCGVEGGVSELFRENQTTPFFSITLAPGEGIFQADHRSAIWHYTTPISIVDEPGVQYGIRNTFGVDIHVDR